MYDENNNDYTEDSSRQATEFVEKQGEKAYEIGEIVEMRKEGQVSII